MQTPEILGFDVRVGSDGVHAVTHRGCECQQMTICGHDLLQKVYLRNRKWLQLRQPQQNARLLFTML